VPLRSSLCVNVLFPAAECNVRNAATHTGNEVTREAGNKHNDLRDCSPAGESAMLREGPVTALRVAIAPARRRCSDTPRRCSKIRIV